MNGHPVYSDPHRLCAWYNANMAKPGLLWIVSPSGTPMLVADEAVSAAEARADKERKDEEARRHNWRIMHPITEGSAA